MWNYTNISKESVITLSGWKIYIFGEDIKDSVFINNKITPIAKDYDVTIKLATNKVIERNKVLMPAWGIAVLYLQTELFKNNRVQSLIGDINSQLIDFEKEGCYGGSYKINKHLSVRYDLRVPVTPVVGIDYDKYLINYRGEFGEYNINGNIHPLILK